MKRVILCLDGTWNNNRAGSILTNVCKLHQVVAPTDANGVKQVSHYVEGIVSADGESLQFVKGGIGVGVDDRIRKAYETLVEDYEPGDEIYLIGFSRGAFEARSLGGLITLIGVAKPGIGFSFDRAWSLYRTGEKKRDQAALAEIRAASHYPVRIKCVGVWDTVGNLGNPFVSGGAIGRRYEFHDTRLSDTSTSACTRSPSTSCAGRSGRRCGRCRKVRRYRPTSTSSRSGSPAPTPTSAAAIARPRFRTSPSFGWRSGSKPPLAWRWTRRSS
jgi:uncharacterized protein (DUF2235 family)